MSSQDSINLLQPIQAYFSHSYRAEDRDMNLFFWKLFSEQGFYFTVDPKSERTFVPHLERLIRLSDCFVAIVTRRRSTVQQVGGVVLPQPQSVVTHSPYIEFENRLAARSGKPRLVFVEQGLDANLFGTRERVHTFDRDTLDMRQRLYSNWVEEFSRIVQDYKGYYDRALQPTLRAGILIDSEKACEVYTPEVLDLIRDALRVGGYTTTVISPIVKDDQQFISEIEDLDLLVSEIREPFITSAAFAFVHARYIPMLRVCWLRSDEVQREVPLPDVLSTGYRIGDIDPIIGWRTKDELALEIVLHMQKFQQSRTLLNTFNAGRKYFMSAGRREAKVFVSNANPLNDLALELVKGFQTVNIQFFHYQMTIETGTAWQEQLNRELDRCEVFVALVSDEYYTSRWCQYELQRAFARWKEKQVVLLPYLITSTRLPDLIKDHIQCKNMHGFPLEDVVKEIVETVDGLLTEGSPSRDYSQAGQFDYLLDGTTIPGTDLVKAVKDTLDLMSDILPIKRDVRSAWPLGDGICRVDVDIEQVVGDLRDFPKQVPFLFLRSPSVGPTEVDVLRSHFAEQPGKVALVILPAVAEGLQQIRQTLDEQIRKPYASDLVILGHSEIRAIVHDEQPKTAFRRAILLQTNIVNYAPFILNDPVPENIFFGRESELRTVCERARKSSFAVIGSRRIGKTSILNCLHRGRLPDLGYRTVYHDCSTIMDPRSFLNSGVQWNPGPPPGTSVTFSELFESVPTAQPVVVLLDEADRLVSTDRANGWKLFNTMRTLASSSQVQFVFSGEQTLRQALRDPNSPLFNFADEILLGCLDFQAVKELITQPMKQLEIELTDEMAVTRRIFEFTSGHPNVVQRFCYRLLEQLSEQDARRARRISLEHVDAVIADPDFIRKDFLETFFSRATALEHVCALLMATNKELRTLTSVHKALSQKDFSVNLNQVDAALERLVDLRRLLRRTADGYEFAVTAFPLIISRSERVSDWIALRRESFVLAGDIPPETAPIPVQGTLW